MTTETQQTTTQATAPTLPPYSPELIPEAYRNSESFKNFKSWEDVFKSHDEARRLIGADKNTVLKIPTEGEIPADVWKRLGKPDKYEVSTGLLEALSPATRAALGDIAGKANLTARQFAELTVGLDQQAKAEMAATLTQAETAKKLEDSAIRLELGAAYEQNVNLAKDVLVTFQHPELWDKLEQSGLTRNTGFINLMAEIGKLMGDDHVVSGQPTTFRLSPEQAANEITAKTADPVFFKRYTDAREIGHAEAVAEMQRLYKAKFGG